MLNKFSFLNLFLELNWDFILRYRKCQKTLQILHTRCAMTTASVSVTLWKHCTSEHEAFQINRLVNMRPTLRLLTARKGQIVNSFTLWIFPFPSFGHQERYTCPSLALHPLEDSFVAQTNGDYMAVFSSQRPYRMNKRRRYEGHKVSNDCCLWDGDARGAWSIQNSDVNGNTHTHTSCFFPTTLKIDKTDKTNISFFILFHVLFTGSKCL